MTWPGDLARTALFAACFAIAGRARAHDGLAPPSLLSQPTAEWPRGRELPHDLIVPVVLTVGTDGSPEAAKLEAGVGEPFDSVALATARRFRFSPARDAQGPRRAILRVVVRFVGEPALAPAARTDPSAPASTGSTSSMSKTVVERAATASPAIVVRDTPPARSASETVIDRPLLAAAPHKNASELLLVVPGVFVSQHSGEGKAQQIFFRGFDAAHGQDVELWAGGAPVNDVSNIHGQGYADLHFLIPEVVDAIRSSPGTYDPRQGDFAVAGSLHFDLGYRQPGITATASLGSFGARRYFLGYRPKQAPETTFAAFELGSSDGFGPSRAARRGSAIAQVDHPLGGGVGARLLASTYAGRFDSAGVARLDDIESGALKRWATYDPKQGGRSSRSQLVLELSQARASDEQGRGERWALSPFVVLRSLELRSNFTGRLTSSEGDSIQQLNDATTVGASASYRRDVKLFSRSHRLEAGVFLRSDAIRQSQHRLSTLTDRVTDDESSPGIDAELRATNAAGYLDASLYPLSRVALRAGLRADALAYSSEDRGGESAGQARSAAGAQLSKRGTLDLGLLPGLNALFSYGEGFRSPQARSLGDGETTPFTRVVSYEAGLRWRDGSRFQSALAVYQSLLSDDLLFDQTTARNELVPGTRRSGVSASLSARPLDWFLSSTSFTFTHAQFRTGNERYQAGEPLPYVPQLVVRSDLGVSPKLGRLFGHELESHFGSALTYQGRRPLPYREFGHDALLFDVSAELRIGPIETGVEVFNLLNADWYDGEFVYASRFSAAASMLPARHVTVGPPRMLLWSLTLFV